MRSHGDALRAQASRRGRGYGTCLRCDYPWSHVDGHSTQYSNSSGCFPLCEECWQELATPEARMPFYRLLWERWRSDSPDSNGTPWPEVWEQMRAAVEAGL